MLLDYLEDNIVLVIPDSIKNNVLKIINSLDTIYNLKIMNKDELLKSLTYSYDEKTIYYLMNKYHYKYDIALMYLNNIKYIDYQKYNNTKLDDLVKIKNKLADNNLLIYNQLLKNSLKNKKIIIYGYDYLSNYDKKILNNYNYKFIKDDNKDYKHPIYSFNTLDEEVEYVAYRISSLIKNGVDINNIKIANINDEYYISMKRIFDLYNIPLKNIFTSSIYSTKIVQDFLNTLDINSLEYDFNNEDNKYILDSIIRVLNKYYFVDNLCDIKEVLKEEFKNIKNNTIKMIKEVEVININNNIFDDNDYIFFMNFNQGSAPQIVKDEDYLSDKEKNLLGLENKYELNKINKDNLINKLKSIKNMEITYKLKSTNGVYEPSFIIDDLGYDLIDSPKIEYNYSHKMNKLKLSLMLDDLVKYQNQNDDLSILFANYKDIPYYTYDNSFKGILLDDFMQFIDHKLSLSYSSLDNYYKCGFRYYLTNILKIDNTEDKFVTKIGNVFHKVLEEVYKDHISFEDSFKSTLTEYEFNAKEQMFVDKLKEDLKFIIDTINKQNKYSSLDKTLCEERVFVNKDKNIKLTFTGVIDKLMYKEVDGYNYTVIIDYKTGNPNINLNNVYYGINMQLPIYVYLANKKINNVKIIGFYLQKILHSKPLKDSKKDLLKLKEDELKLEGYTNSNLDYVNLFDSNLDSSEVIKSFKTNKDGTINAQAHTLSDLEINKLVKIADEKIDNAFDKILAGDFAINPKIIDNENIGCKYCKYQDICFRKEENNIYLNKKDYKEFLKEGD